MKLSLLIPSLYPKLMQRMLASIRQNTLPEGWDLEIVINSPYIIAAPDIVHVPEKEPKGTNPAMRTCFKASHGDVIACLPDDMIIAPHCLEIGLAALNQQPDTIVALDGGAFKCFDRRYAICPMTLRRTVEKYWEYFFPYKSHWGDPAFSLHLWRKGGQVLRMAGGQVHWGLDRMGEGEASTKTSTFDQDYARFLEDFKEMTPGYDLKNWLSFNHT